MRGVILIAAAASMAVPSSASLISSNAECAGCRKDLFSGRYVYCDGYYSGSTVTHCDWVGGPGDCTFTPEKSVTLDQCKAKCEADPNCNYYASYANAICNLFMMNECRTVSWVGDVYSTPAPAPTVPAPTSPPRTLVANSAECTGCRKDLFAGQYVYCNGYYQGSTVTHCDWVGGAGDCTFTPEKSVTIEQCQAKCEADPNCRYYASYANSICNLFMMEQCQVTSWVGSVFSVPPPPTPNPTPKPTPLPTTPQPTRSPTLRPTPVQHTLVRAGAECTGCRKDLYGGRYVYCNGYYQGSTVTHCDWVGGAGGCTFTPQRSVTLDQCKAACEADPNCNYYASYYNMICNLFMMEQCQVTSWPGNVYSL